MQCLHAACDRILLVEGPAVAAAFDKGDTRDHRIAGEGFERKDERAFDEAVDQQPMRVGIDLGCAAVVTLEMEAVWRDGPIEEVMRGARGTGAGGARRAREDPNDLRLVSRGLTV